MTKYEITEIFNNYKRSSDNRIHYHDLLNSLRSNNPTSFYVQSDPTYLKELEALIINNENKVKDLESLNLTNERKFEKILKEKHDLIDLILKEKEQLIMKITLIDQEKQSSQKVINELLSNTNFNKTKGKEEANAEDVKTMNKLKSKITQLEEQNLTNVKNFDRKIQEYDEKIKKMQSLFESGATNKTMEKKIEDITKENIEIKNKFVNLEGKEKVLTTENIKLKEKLKKYKKNYSDLVEKSEKDKQQKKVEPPKHGLTGKNADMFMLANKIEEMEQKNKDREEHYKILCVNANAQQLNKEIEAVRKKFDAERKEYQRLLNVKNAELLEIKKDFQDIINEMEELKNIKKTR